MSNANFERAVLVDVDLNGANLYGANFEGALLVKVDLRGANLMNTRLDGARFVDCATERADMGEAQRAALSGRS